MQYLAQIGLMALIAYFSTMAGEAFSATVRASVSDGSGNFLEHAVVTLIGGEPEQISSRTTMPPPIMTQHNIQFNPFVLPVAVGTTVSFPNKDKIRHHVYSFSKVKRFELELYGEDEEKSVLFDQQGAVALGCNIHDGMLAYIYVARSNNFAKSDAEGKAEFDDIAPGNYTAYVWHPRLRGNEEELAQKITVGAEGFVDISFEVPLKRERNRKRSTY